MGKFQLELFKINSFFNLRSISIIVIILLCFTFVYGQQDSVKSHLPEFKNRPLVAAIEVASSNILINRYNAIVRDLDWAKVTPEDWSNNLHSGFNTDGDAFGTNFLGHPYHGSLYFNAARKNGASFWGSIPYVLAGSWTWEYFGETFPPSEIDWNTTTLGGVYLGEVSHRLTAHLLRNDKKRGYRFIRNLSALALDPIGHINGLLYAANKSEIRSSSYREFPIRSQFAFGPSYLFKANETLPSTSYMHMNYSLIYGDLFNDNNKYEPFDFFILRAWLDINNLKDYNKNFLNITSHAPLWKINNSDKNLFTISSHYDFTHNTVFKVGAISLSVDYHLNLKSENTSFQSAIKLGPILFGSSKSDVVEVIDIFLINDGEFLRDYVYGKGYMFESEALLVTKDYGRMIMSFNNWVIYTQRDSPGTERNSIFKFEYYYPIWKNWGLGFEFFRYHRAAHYKEFIEYQNIRNGYSEIKLLGVVSF